MLKKLTALMIALSFLTSCTTSYAEESAPKSPTAFPLHAGTPAPADSVCYDEINFPLLAGQLAQCGERKQQLEQCKKLLDEIPERGALEWYESPWFWGIVGIGIGLGTTITIKAF